MKEIHFSGGLRHLLPGLGVRQVARELRRRRIVASRELDTAATLQASLRRGGLFTPVFGSRAEPDYLVLIDRSSFADHQARLADEIVLTLQLGDVSVERFYYHGDPRRCRREVRKAAGPDGETLTLDEMTARFPEHRVLVFSDGTGFFDRFSGEPVPWLDLLGGWSQKVVLTPESPARWGRREWAIEKLGFTLLPLSRAGLGVLVDLFRERPKPSFSTPTTAAAATPLFVTEPTRWLERHSPSPETVDRLCRELRDHLGPAGFQWLAACAVYPEIHWGLTLRLGASLPGSNRDFETLLPRLSRLVWLRECYLPDWLRGALLAQLDPATQQQVRLLLQELLTQTVMEPNEVISLRIATPAPPADRRWWQHLRERVTGTRPGGKLADAARIAGPDSPLRDYVFLRFMSGEDAAQLSVTAPRLLLRLLFPQGVRWFGLRRVAGLAGCAVASIALFAVMKEKFVPQEVAPIIVDANFSPNSRTLVIASLDRTARLWDATTGQQIGVPLKHGGIVLSASFSPDGTRVVTASDDQTARLWDATTGQQIGVPLKHDRVVWSASFSPDGTRVVTASSDQTARIWGATTGQQIGVPLKHDRAVLSARFSPDRKRVVTASFDQTARIWDATTGQQIGVPLKHDREVRSASFSPDGTRVVTASFDRTARIWDATTGQQIGVPLKHDREVFSASFSPDGTRVVTASADQTARLWDARSSKQIGEIAGTLQNESNFCTANFSPDGTRLVTASAEQIRVWSVPSPASGRRNSIEVKVPPEPVAKAQPSHTTVVEGSSVTLRSSSDGTPPLTFQWYRSGIAIPGATGSTFVIAAATRYDSGTYHVVVSSIAGSRAESPVRLIVEPGTPVTSGQPDRRELTQPSPVSDQPLENTLEMKFVPVPGTDVLFSIWDTRVKDYEKFALATNRRWLRPRFSQTPEDPAVNVSWDDAQAFCAWLTRKDQAEGRLKPNQKYRLPTDAEWSVAVGLSEAPGGTPQSKSLQIRGVYPWGTQWPAPRGAGNYGGTETRDAYWQFGRGVIEGYNDGYARTSPVGSFKANKFGLYDMGGNVWQWCEDSFDGKGGSPVLRGASYPQYGSDTLLSSVRNNYSAANDDIGFRCVVAVASSPKK